MYDIRSYFCDIISESTAAIPTIDCIDPDSICLPGSNLTQVPRDQISPTTELVDLKGNTIQILSRTSFSGFINIRILLLSSNTLKTIQGGAFKDLGILSYLDLGENDITTIHGDIWDGLHSLKTLRISGNPIQNLPSGAFPNLPNLTLVMVDLLILKSIGGELCDHATYPDTRTAPEVGLQHDTDLPCNSSMCGLKKLEDKGMMKHYDRKGVFTRPRCRNKTLYWDEYSETLKCSGYTVTYIYGLVFQKFDEICLI